MKRWAAGLLAMVWMGQVAAIDVINESSVQVLPSDPLRVTFESRAYGREMIVKGAIGPRTVKGEPLREASLAVRVLDAQGATIWEGNTGGIAPGGQIEWRVNVRPAGQLDEKRVQRIVLTDSRVVVLEPPPKVGQLPLDIQSEVPSMEGEEWTATIDPSPRGRELVVRGVLGARLRSGERLSSVALKFDLLTADGTELHSMEPREFGPGGRVEVRVLLTYIDDKNQLDRVRVRDTLVRSMEQVAREEKAKRDAEARERKDRETAQAKAVQRRLEERTAAVKAKRWPAEIERAVIDRKVMLGMNAEQVTMSWGRPERINETLTAGRRSEQWVFGGRSYVYLDNGKVTSIQSTR